MLPHLKTKTIKQIGAFPTFAEAEKLLFAKTVKRSNAAQPARAESANGASLYF